MARTDPQLNVRIPLELRAKLEDAAKANSRSLTGELVSRLEASFDPLTESIAKRRTDTNVLPMDLGKVAETLKHHLERLEAILSDREVQIGDQFKREFGVDLNVEPKPAATNRGPLLSDNAKRPLVKRSPKK